MLSPRKGLVLIKPYVDKDDDTRIVNSALNKYKRGVVERINPGDRKDDNKYLTEGRVVLFTNPEEVNINKESYYLVHIEDIRGSLDKAGGKYPLVY